jgi:hypothetical protein
MVRVFMQQGMRCIGLEFQGRKAVAKFLSKTHSFFALDCSLLEVDGQHAVTDRMIYDQYRKVYATYHFASLQCKRLSFDDYFLMKESHKYKKDSPHFLKTLNDLRKMKREMGMSVQLLNDHRKQILKLREQETYTNSLPKLNQSKKSFFTDSVPYVYDHDSIHEVVKHLDKPAYSYYIEDGQEVKCSREKFEALPNIVQLYGVLEESYVLALERAVIPHGTDPKKAFDIALSKVCTSITSGWFREFAYENYHEVQAMYHKSFVDKFKIALDNSKIKPYVKGTY